MAITYRHTQIGYVVLILCFLPAIVVGSILARRPEPVGLLVLAVIVVVGICFGSMTVQVADGRLQWYFGPGLIRKQVAIKDICAVTPVRNKWYYGWGIRYTPYGWLYNVSGLEAVELRLSNGKTLRLGTDRPHQLIQAIGQQIWGNADTRTHEG
ncbi:MAG: hypothetical protein QHH07_10015 [Sedimentisphaerales bacterium]|jgi:hypothetical protein|nr:hypothetical protein [Sedimentisphaerales bacterium]